jgi:HD-GYP domain-containing protein (c-di-GMP phosphodiesterase class II)
VAEKHKILTSEGPPLYSSKIISTYLMLIRNKYGRVDIPTLLESAGMEPYQVEDGGHWFSQEQIDRFHGRLEEVTGNHNIAREAGRFSASPGGLGLLSRYVLGLAGPAGAFEIIGNLAANLTRSTKYEYRKVGTTEIELTVVPNEGVREKPYQCENRMGYFEAIVSGFNYRMPRIEQTECIFRGGKACRYRISWRKSAAAILKLTRNLFGAVAVLGLIALMAFSSPHAFLDGLGASVIVLLALSSTSEYLEKRELNIAINNLRSTAEGFLENADRNYNQALMINEIGHAISEHNRTDDMLLRVLDVLRKRLDYDRGLILLASEDGFMLEFRAGFGYSEELEDELRQASFSLDKKGSRGIFVLCFRGKKPYLVNDAGSIEGELTQHSLEFLRKTGSKSFICCPILFEEECLGVLAVDNLRSKRALLESDLNLIMGIAPEIGISVHSALLTEERERQFRSILRTLAASIDARDNLTAGHSERVTEYAMGICEEMDLPRELTEVIRVAAQLHDYGKIGIKDSILKKTGPLTGKEREEIKAHVVKTRDILERINFRGAYQQVPFIAGSHHERLDGTGYPMGLKGEEIPLGARIIAVADFFEAITAKRHYHEPRAFDEAIEMLKAEKGHHLDEAVVQALIKVLNNGKPRETVSV